MTTTSSTTSLRKRKSDASPDGATTTSSQICARVRAMPAVRAPHLAGKGPWIRYVKILCEQKFLLDVSGPLVRENLGRGVMIKKPVLNTLLISTETIFAQRRLQRVQRLGCCRQRHHPHHGASGFRRHHHQFTTRVHDGYQCCVSDAQNVIEEKYKHSEYFSHKYSQCTKQKG